MSRVSLLLCAAAFLLSATCPAPAQETDPVIALRAYAGFAPDAFTYRAQRWTPLWVEVENHLENIEGMLVIEKKEALAGEPVTRYTRSVELPKHSRKKFPFMIWIGENEQKEITVSLLGRGGRAIAFTTIPLMSVHEDREMILVFASDPRGYRHLTRLGGPRRSVSLYPQRYLVSGDPAALHCNDMVLSSASAIVAEAHLLAQLTPSQRECLKCYVYAGGRLVITPGRSALEAREALSDRFFPVTIGDSTLEADDTVLAKYGVQRTGGKLPVLESVPRAGAFTVLGNGKAPLVVRRRAGLGSVTFVACDLANPLIRTLPADSCFHDDLLGDRHVPAFADARTFPGEGDYPGPNESPSVPVRRDLETTILLHSMTRIPPVQFVGALLAAYVIVLVPLNFLVFRLAKRTELAWAAVPVIAIGFSFLGLKTGMDRATRTLTATGIGIVECGVDSPVAVKTQILGFYSPVRREYELDFPDGTSLPFHSRANLGHRGLGEDRLVVSWDRQAPTARLKIHARSQRVLEVDGIERIGEGFQGRLTQAGGRLTGQVSNRSPFALGHTILVYLDQAIPLGPLPAGGTVEIDTAIAGMPKAKSALATVIHQGLESGLPRATSQIATTYLRTRHDTLGPIFLLGWHEGLTSVPTLKGHPVEHSGLSLFAVKLPLTLGKGIHRLPPGFVKRSLIETDCTSLSSLVNRHFLWSGEEATWRFHLPPEYGPVRVRSLEISTITDSDEKRRSARLQPTGAATHQMDFLLFRGDRQVKVATTFPFVHTRRWSPVQRVTGQQYQYYYDSETELPRMAAVVEVE